MTSTHSSTFLASAKLALLKALGWFIGSVPLVLLSAVIWIATWISFDLFRIRRKVSLRNIQRALPEVSEAERVRLVRRAYYNFGFTTLEFLGSKKRFTSMSMEVIHPEILENALKQRKGVFILCIHLGNWEFMCSSGAKRFARASILAKDVGKGATAEFVTQMRADNGCFVIPRGGSINATQRIYQCLSQNEIVGFMVDQSRPGSPRIPLFGEGALTNVGLFQLWMRKPAPIIPVVTRRTGLGKHEMRFFEELEVEQPEGLKFKETVIHNGHKMNKIVEQMILTAPEQYFWMHRRWK